MDRFRGALLLERDAELDRLHRLLEAARDGAGSVVLVQGPPGIGKTVLLQRRASERERRGWGYVTPAPTYSSESIRSGWRGSSCALPAPRWRR